MEKIVIALLIVLLFGCVHSSNQIFTKNEPVTFYVYPSRLLKDATKGDKAIEANLAEIFRHLGKNGPNGRVGIGIVFPYLTWTEGKGRGPYKIPQDILSYHEAILRIASTQKIPVMVQFNGAVWHTSSSDSAFLNYWKTKDGGKYLSKYKDGQVNASIPKSKKISNNLLKKYLSIDPYDPNKQDSLFLTLSPYAQELRQARIGTLREAVKFWKALDLKFPGVIQDFTTDSEVSNFSFRDMPGEKKEIPIGFEEWNTDPFCRKNDIKDCAAFFEREEFLYSDPIEKKWHEFRSKNHQIFIQDTVQTIRESFTDQPIYTHQIAVLDEEAFHQEYRRQDLASPQWAAIVEQALPGFTVYTYSGDQYGTKKKFIEQVRKKVGSQPWGFLEFNTARAFNGTKRELALFTYEFLTFAQAHGVKVVAPLAWESNALDNAIKDSGVDDGIKAFVQKTSN
jgi:hypothetical protein